MLREDFIFDLVRIGSSTLPTTFYEVLSEQEKVDGGKFQLGLEEQEEEEEKEGVGVERREELLKSGTCLLYLLLHLSVILLC